jgi:small-conductance mechanosensitive channel
MGMNRVDEFLQHYASQYYDPAKAHEYYIKNRKLKGRTTRNMSDKQKEAWTYAEDKIKTEKKSKVEGQKKASDIQIQQLRDRATQTRERISEKLRLLNSSLQKDEKESARKNASAERERVRTELKAAIEKVRASLKDARTKLDASYEAKYQNEYNNIVTKIPGKKKSKK